MHEITDNNIEELRPGDLLFYYAFEGAYRRWNSMQHVELFLGWTVNTEGNIIGRCLSTRGDGDGVDVGIYYRSFSKDTITSNGTSCLKWYARLSAGNEFGSSLVNIVDLAAISPDNPITWSPIGANIDTEDKYKTNWRLIETNDNSTQRLLANRAYTILFTAKHTIPNSYTIPPNIMWNFKPGVSTGPINTDYYGKAEVNNSCF